MELILKDISEFIIDCEHKTAPIQEFGYPSIRTPNIGKGNLILENVNRVSESTYAEWTKRGTPQEGDLIIAREAPVGNVAIIPKNLKVCLGQRTVLVRPNKKIVNPQYLCYMLLGDELQGQILTKTTGATVAHLNMKDIRELKLSKLPALPFQKKIASILSAYDELIENNKQRIKLLEEMGEEIYKEWFVRLRFPGYENSKFYTSRRKEVMYNTIGAIPENWEYSLLENHIKFYRGKSYSSEELRDSEGLPMLNLKNVNRGGSFRRDGLKYFEGKYSTNNLAYSGDIIMAVTDMTQNREIVGRVARVPEMNISNFIFSMDLIRIEPVGYPKNFIYSFFRYSGIGLKLAEFANGANVLHLTPSLITKQKVKLPTIELAEKFEKIVNPFLEEIDVLENKNQLLQETRDLLLPRLISGKLSVEHLAEEDLGMVAEPRAEYKKA